MAGARLPFHRRPHRKKRIQRCDVKISMVGKNQALLPCGSHRADVRSALLPEIYYMHITPEKRVIGKIRGREAQLHIGIQLIHCLDVRVNYRYAFVILCLDARLPHRLYQYVDGGIAVTMHLQRDIFV